MTDAQVQRLFHLIWLRWNRSKYGVAGFKSEAHAYRWAREAGWKEGMTIVRLDEDLPFAPTNCEVATIMKEKILDGEWVRLRDRWNKTCQVFQENLAKASDQQIDRTIRNVRTGKLWPIEHYTGSDR